MRNSTKFLLSLFLLCYGWNIQGQSYLKFSGTNSYVTWGNNSKLGLASFTLECWFQRQGTGATTSTGTGGVTAVPLITKGRGESDGSNVDCNYFFGINSTGNVLTADFEEGATGTTPGLNHPISGVTAISNNVWYHGAVTYDGTTWNLYLNGVLEKSLKVSQPCQNLSIQHSALASALTSTGAAQGFFNGAIDEVRVWNFAKTQAQIRAAINTRLNGPQTGLVAKWGLDEGAGTSVRDTSGNAINGTIKGTGYSWVTGTAPFNINFPPEVSIASPLASCLLDSAKLGLSISDKENDTITVKFYARPRIKAPDKFTIIALPDVQFYTEQSNGGSNEIFKAQTRWIVSQKDTLGIKYVCQLGDCAQNGDNGGNDIEWKRADTSMKIIEDTATTKLPEGFPYTMCVGNHDQSANGDASGTTLFYNQYFGDKRFSGRSYWGGVRNGSADNNYQLWSASGMDFITVSLEYDTKADSNVIKWADTLLKTYSNRKAIIVSHWIINADGTFGAQGAAVYARLKTNPNLMLMLCGHINPNGEASRYDVYNGTSVPTLLSDYQDRTKGGNGWLRIMTMNPDKNTIDVKSYSPTLKQYETDANSQFTVTNLNLFNSLPYTVISTQTLVGGNGTVNFNWKNLLKDTAYEWYAEASDKKNKVTSAVQQITTRVPMVNLGKDTSLCNGVLLNAGNTGMLYAWNNGLSTQSIKTDTSGVFSVKVTHPASLCASSDTIVVVVNTTPKVNLGIDVATCEQPVLLDAGNAGMNFKWNNGTSAQTLTAAISGTYNVEVTNPVTKCIGKDTVSVLVNKNPIVNLGSDIAVCAKTTLDAGNAGKTILWSTMDSTQAINIASTGLYVVKVTEPLTKCFTYDSISVTVNPYPVVNLGQDIVKCGGQVNLDAQNPGSTYIWSDQSGAQMLTVSQTGDYFVTVKNIYQCAKSDSIHVLIKAIPAKPALSGKTSYCDGEIPQTVKAQGSDIAWYSDSVLGNMLARGNSYYPQVNTSAAFYATQTVNGCAGPAAKLSILFHPIQKVNILNGNLTYYDNDSAITLKGTPSGGVFSGFGVASGKFDPAAAGAGGPYKIMYMYTSPFGCSNDTFVGIKVIAHRVDIRNVVLGADLTLYPNPAEQLANLHLQLKEGKTVGIEILDITGKSITIQSPAYLTSGTYDFTIDRKALGLAPGTYKIVLTSGNEQNIINIIFQ